MNNKLRNVFFLLLALISLITLSSCKKQPKVVGIKIITPESGVIYKNDKEFSKVKVYKIYEQDQVLSDNLQPVIEKVNGSEYLKKATVTLTEGKKEYQDEFYFIENKDEYLKTLNKDKDNNKHLFYNYKFLTVRTTEEMKKDKNPNNYLFTHNRGYAFEQEKLEKGLELTKITAKYNETESKFELIEDKIDLNKIKTFVEIKSKKGLEVKEFNKDSLEMNKYHNLESYKVYFDINNDGKVEKDPFITVTVAGGQKPINLHKYNFKQSWFDWVLVNWFAWLMQATAIAGYLSVGIFFTTIIVRSIAWPIYAKTNRMSSKMQEAQPEIAAVQAKYHGRTDKQSQRMMQLELSQVYKKHKIGFSSLLIPFLQMPIFIAVYQSVSRITLEGGLYASKLKTTSLLGIDLSIGGHWTSYLLAAIVGGTMILLLWISTRKPLYMKNTKKHNNQALDERKTSNQARVISMVMVVMMVMFSVKNNAIAFYWVIGNIFAIFQTLFYKRLNYKRYVWENASDFNVNKPKNFKEKFINFFTIDEIDKELREQRKIKRQEDRAKRQLEREEKKKIKEQQKLEQQRLKNNENNEMKDEVKTNETKDD